MSFEEYLNYLLDINIEFREYISRPHLFFTQCIGGDCSSVSKDLIKLIEKPIKEFTKRDWQSTGYILSKVYYSKHLKEMKNG